MKKTKNSTIYLKKEKEITAIIIEMIKWKTKKIILIIIIIQKRKRNKFYHETIFLNNHNYFAFWINLQKSLSIEKFIFNFNFSYIPIIQLLSFLTFLLIIEFYIFK